MAKGTNERRAKIRFIHYSLLIRIHCIRLIIRYTNIDNRKRKKPGEHSIAARLYFYYNIWHASYYAPRHSILFWLMRNLIFYTKPGCHLCEDGQWMLEVAMRNYELPVMFIDITTDADLTERYGHRSQYSARRTSGAGQYIALQ